MASAILEPPPTVSTSEATILRDYRERLARELAELDRQIRALASG